MAVYSVYITLTLRCYILARLTPPGPSYLVRLNFEFLVESLLIYEVSLLRRNCG